MSMSICKVCKEPLWNFLCLDCLREDIEAWIPSAHIARFLEFHNSFTNHFLGHADATFDSCLKCKGRKQSQVCAFCYINELISWASNTDSQLADHMRKSFVFSFERKGEFDGFFRNTRLEPLTQINCERESFGICDNCGEYSEELEQKEGSWLCSECREHDTE